MTMGIYPKFILTSDGHLRLGMVNMHRDLLYPDDHCIGGGYYHIEASSMRLVLDRESYDYGSPQWSRVSRLIVPRDYEGLQIVYLSSSWPYEEINIASILPICYE